MNLPNKISITRICMIPIFVLIFFLDGIPFNYGIAAILFVLAACTDFIDGYIARSRGLVTNLGKFLDPIADKVLVSTAMFLILAIKEELFGAVQVDTEVLYVITVVCVCIIMARELIISAFRQIAAVNGVVMAADMLGKYKTTFQDVSIFFLLFSVEFYGGFGGFLFWFGFICFLVATVLTVWSGISYVLKNKQVLKDN